MPLCLYHREEGTSELCGEIRKHPQHDTVEARVWGVSSRSTSSSDWTCQMSS